MLLGKHWSKDDCWTNSNESVSAKERESAPENDAAVAERKMMDVHVSFIMLLDV